MLLLIRSTLALGLVGGVAAAERPPAGFGPALALGMTRSSIRSTMADTEYGARTSMAAALRLNWTLANGLGFMGALQVAQFGFSDGPRELVLDPDQMCTTPDDCPRDVETALNMMSVQFGARYQLRSVPIYVGIGIEVGFLMGARSRSGSDDEVIDSTRHFVYRVPVIAQRLSIGVRPLRLVAFELTWHLPVNSWGNGSAGQGPTFADDNAAIMSLVLGK